MPGEAVGTQPSEVLPSKEDTPRPKEETTEKEEDLRTTAVETEKATILIAEDTDSNVRMRIYSVWMSVLWQSIRKDILQRQSISM